MATNRRAARWAAARVRSGASAAVAALALFAAFALSSLLATGPAHAVPSFARQTGQPCAACHTAFPELTPFGRRFKLAGYTLQGGDWKGPPVALMAMPGFTHTRSAQDAPPDPGLKTNDNFVTQQVTGLLAGQIYGNLGSFIQVSGNPVTGQVWFDGSDVRYVDQFKIFGADAYLGLTANNTPTIQDVWNTVNAWQFPELSSSVAAFAPPGTHIDALAQQVGGAGAYIFWNDMLYAELTAYGGYNKSTLEAFGVLPAGVTPDVQVGVQPYWRLAFEPHWGDNYLEVGTFGMYSRTAPSGVFSPTGATDNYTDIGFDSQYQYDGSQYSVTVKLSDIIEYQNLNSTFSQGGSSNLNDRLNSFKANATFVWDHTYELTGGYFNVSGTKDCGLYGSLGPCITPVGNSANNSPNGSGLIFDAAYLPFSHGSPAPYSTYNARIGVQYVHYLQLYGGTSNFDGSGLGGTHNASGNDTLFLYAWAAF
jgi:hypothetical protein